MIIIITITDIKMNETSFHSIITLPFTASERNSHNRRKSRYHTFVAIYLKEFAESNYEKKKNALVSSGIHRIQQYYRHEDAPRIYDPPAITSAQRLRLASLHWARLPLELKDAWKERAKLANELPLIGVFASVPENVSNDHVLICINNEMNRFVKVMHRALKKAGGDGPDICDSILFKSFNKEKKIPVRSKIFRSIYINHLLKLIYFGSQFCCVKAEEIIHRTSKVCIIYIHSKERMIELFEKKDRCAFEAILDEEKKIGCCGRAIVRSIETGLERIGYVMEEEGDRLFIQLEGADDNRITIAKPSFDNDIGRWIFVDSGEYEWIEYDPIRIKVHESGNIHLLFHHVIYNEKNKLIEESYY